METSRGSLVAGQARICHALPCLALPCRSRPGQAQQAMSVGTARGFDRGAGPDGDAVLQPSWTGKDERSGQDLTGLAEGDEVK